MAKLFRRKLDLQRLQRDAGVFECSRPDHGEGRERLAEHVSEGDGDRLNAALCGQW